MTSQAKTIWTFDEDEILRDAWTRGLTGSQTHALLPFKGLGSIHHRRVMLGLTRKETRSQVYTTVPKAFSEPYTPVIEQHEALDPLTDAGRPWPQRRMFQCAFPTQRVDDMVYSCCATIETPTGYCKKHREIMYEPKN